MRRRRCWRSIARAFMPLRNSLPVAGVASGQMSDEYVPSQIYTPRPAHCMHGPCLEQCDGKCAYFIDSACLVSPCDNSSVTTICHDPDTGSGEAKSVHSASQHQFTQHREVVVGGRGSTAVHAATHTCCFDRRRCKASVEGKCGRGGSCLGPVWEVSQRSGGAEERNWWRHSLVGEDLCTPRVHPHH